MTINFICPYCQATLCVDMRTIATMDGWECGYCLGRSLFRADPDRLYLKPIEDVAR